MTNSLGRMRKTGLVIFSASLATLAVLSCAQREANSLMALTESSYDPGVEWRLDWADEFEEEHIDTANWNFQVLEAGRFNDEWQRYTNSSENAYIQEGSLLIKAMHESDVHGMGQYSSARMNTANKHAWKYGKIAARIQLPQGKGMWPAFWMLGANINEAGGDTPWPQSGEIDILELYGSKDDGVIEGNIHYANENDSHSMMGALPFKLEQGIFADAYHIFELEWDRDSITWFVDGQKFASTSIAAEERSEFHKEFFILLNLAVGGTYAGRPDTSTVFPQYMYIDWVRVYKKEE